MSDIPPSPIRSHIMAGALIGLLFGPTWVGIVFTFNIHGGLASGVGLIDSLLYATGGGPITLAIVTAIWSFLGVSAGVILGTLSGYLSVFLRDE